VGPSTAEQPSSVVSMTYRYGSRPVQQGSGLGALVFAAGNGAEEKLSDPNCYPIVLGA
jgi:hypothetical protein